MPCFHPFAAYQLANGGIVFAERSGQDVVRTLTLPCGQCVGCRLERSRQWAVRCMHEAQMWESSVFVTLTYREEECPGSLDYVDFQKFIRRLRKRRRPDVIRFFACGEYGEELSRPHFHACLFNVDFPDRSVWKTGGGVRLYRSKELEELWPFGFSSFGAVTFESAAYVARYCVKKVTGDRRAVEEWYAGRVPEFAQMSRRPGIGAPWLEKYWKDVHRDHQVVVGGRKSGAPRFYRDRLGVLSPDFADVVQCEREAERVRNAWDNTDERLRVREVVCQAGLTSKGGRLGVADSRGARSGS